MLPYPILIEASRAANTNQPLSLNKILVVINNRIVEMVGIVSVRGQFRTGEWLVCPTCQWIGCGLWGRAATFREMTIMHKARASKK